MREVERTITTVINAALRPRCRAYLRGIDDLADDVLVMTSSGGLLPVADAAELPAALLLSGPAGGVRAGAAAATANGFPDAVTFDMGGTSTDVCLIVDGAPAPAATREVGGFTVRFPALDVHTIGAGGGSIARIDPGGALVVGPQSAGADPGPACYGRGGDRPTVTDANLVAGHIAPAAAFGGLTLDRAAAAAALEAAGLTAEGVLAVVDANMERALRAVSVERGVDPRGLALVAFGGAGPLHACALADALAMPAVIVPARAGVLSAVGLLTAPQRRDLVRSWPTPGDHTGLAAARAELADRARALVAAPTERGRRRDDDVIEVATALDCRYRGQSHELTVDDVAAFHDEHRRRNGYARPDDPVEVVALRATATRPPAVEPEALPPPDRLAERAERGAGDAHQPPEVVGPAVIAEPDCTVWVAEGWVARPGAAGALVLRRTGRASTRVGETSRAPAQATRAVAPRHSDVMVNIAPTSPSTSVRVCSRRDRSSWPSSWANRASIREKRASIASKRTSRPPKRASTAPNLASVRPSARARTGRRGGRRAEPRAGAGRLSWPRRPNRRAGAGP